MFAPNHLLFSFAQTRHQPAAKSANVQSHEGNAERYHPETENWQKAEDTASDEQ